MEIKIVRGNIFDEELIPKDTVLLNSCSSDGKLHNGGQSLNKQFNKHNLSMRHELRQECYGKFEGEPFLWIYDNSRESNTDGRIIINLIVKKYYYQDKNPRLTFSVHDNLEKALEMSVQWALENGHKKLACGLMEVEPINGKIPAEKWDKMLRRLKRRHKEDDIELTIVKRVKKSGKKKGDM